MIVRSNLQDVPLFTGTRTCSNHTRTIIPTKLNFYKLQMQENVQVDSNSQNCRGEELSWQATEQ